MKNNNLDKQAIPTLEEIQRLYEDILREDGTEEEFSKVESGEFLKNFRKIDLYNFYLNKTKTQREEMRKF